MLVAEEAVEIRVLSRQGKSIREIARMLDVSRNTVRRYLRGEGLPNTVSFRGQGAEVTPVA
jgi:transposase